MESNAHLQIEGWEAFAKHVGGEFIPKEKSLHYRYRGLICEAFNYYHGEGGSILDFGEPDYQLPQTQFRAFLVNKKGVDFKLFRPSFFRLLFGRFIRKDVQPDNREFNGLVEISSNNEVLAASIFSDASLQEKIMDADGYTIYFLPAEGSDKAKFGEGVSVLVFNLPLRATSKEKLKSMNLLFTEMVDKLLDLEVVAQHPPVSKLK